VAGRRVGGGEPVRALRSAWGGLDDLPRARRNPLTPQSLALLAHALPFCTREITGARQAKWTWRIKCSGEQVCGMATHGAEKTAPHRGKGHKAFCKPKFN